MSVPRSTPFAAALAAAHPSRRTALAGLTALGVGAVVPTLSAGTAQAATSALTSSGSGALAAAGPVQLSLPAPTGPHRIGNVALHLIDRSRRDPWVPSHPVRELMIGIWYPAHEVDGHGAVPWLPANAWSAYLQDNAIAPGVVSVPVTHGHDGAPAERRGGPRPVLLFSPGSGGDRDTCTTLTEELVSHGYVVVTIDHTHDSAEVEFPDGRVEPRTIPPDSLPINTEAVSVRTADALFVLDQLCAIAAGRDPDVEHRPLPRGLAEALDLSRVGIYGHSMGGATSAWAMLDDRRIRAGINLDGSLYGPVLNAGLDRPFLFMCSQLHDLTDDPSWAQTWSHLRGWHKELRLANAAHNSYTDLQSLVPEAAAAVGFPPSTVQQLIGTVDPARSVIAVRTYVRAYFDRFVRGHDNHLLDRPSAAFPEIEFLA
ncbi:alpha/beta hydrolase family protein [Catenulispora rubra]|uniref:alpha/beta hydrolase family protein n=1 Tax=Catenulispora rubra TaxID=280293 RepID=UPI0018927A5D|nr:hydrolase [Catenulispora rubra]